MTTVMDIPRPVETSDVVRARPWLSVIMPTHNGEDWIDDALRSIASGPTDGIEVLLFDSSTSTATQDIARRYADRLDLRIVADGGPNMWHAKTNRGAELARAEHLCWLHQDDVWLPGRAEALKAWIAAWPDAALHLSPAAIIGAGARHLGVWRCPLPSGHALPPALVLSRLLVQNFIAAPAPLYRRDACLACGGLDEKLWYTADWDLWLKLATSGLTVYHDKAVTGFRVHGGSLTMTGSLDIGDFKRQMQIVFYRHLAQSGCGSHQIEAAGRVSLEINAALAAASAGDFRALPGAILRLLCLGPFGMRRYWQAARLQERVIPRLRARLRGRL